MSKIPSTTRLLCLAVGLTSSVASAKAAVVRFDFDEEEGATNGWVATPGAFVAEYGRTGRSLCISSYEEERKLGKRPVGHNNAAWTGPTFKLTPGATKSLTVSAWGYAMFS